MYTSDGVWFSERLVDVNASVDRTSVLCVYVRIRCVHALGGRSCSAGPYGEVILAFVNGFARLFSGTFMLFQVTNFSSKSVLQT